MTDRNGFWAGTVRTFVNLVALSPYKTLRVWVRKGEREREREREREEREGGGRERDFNI